MSLRLMNFYGFSALPAIAIAIATATGFAQDNVITIEAHKDWIVSVAFSPDGETIASGSWDGTIKLWKISNGKETLRLNGHGMVTSVAFSPDGN